MCLKRSAKGIDVKAINPRNKENKKKALFLQEHIPFSTNGIDMIGLIKNSSSAAKGLYRIDFITKNLRAEKFDDCVITENRES